MPVKSQKSTARPIVVESGIEMPTQRNRYPFWDMKVGDSFQIECDPDRAKVVRARISGAAASFKKLRASNTQWATRYVESGVRCWRVK